MPTPLNIQELAQSVLDQVSETPVKTASEQELPEEFKTEIGKALKEAASLVRGCDSADVTQEDIHSLFKEAQAQSSKEPVTSEHPSVFGDELRKLAKIVRDRGVEEHTNTYKQAAHMINAAVGLAHLTKTALTPQDVAKRVVSGTRSALKKGTKPEALKQRLEDISSRGYGREQVSTAKRRAAGAEIPMLEPMPKKWHALDQTASELAEGLGRKVPV